VLVSGTATAETGSVIVRLRDGIVGYGGRPVVRADLELHRGEVVALVGANGSGKTTLVKGLLGLAELLGGSLELFGMPATRFRERFRLGYVPQRQALGGPVPATVREVVASGRLGGGGRRRGRDLSRDAVARAVAIVGLTPLLDRAVTTLSGGQQRRVLVARALVGGADALFLDEPLAGVDQASQVEVSAALGELVASGHSVLVVLHELGPLEPLVDRVLWLRDGRVAYDGPRSGLTDHQAHLVYDHDPHGGPAPVPGIGLTG
jgi:zinc transport system ATP-binding protein